MVANMVVDGILYHFHSAGMKLITKLLVAIISAKAFIDLVMIGEPVAMVTGHAVAPLAHFGHIVFDNRCQPQRRNTQLAEIIQVIFDPLEVSSMTGEFVF